VTVAFSLAFVTDPRMPEAAFFVCQQHAPEYFWKPDYQTHPNGALAVSEIVMLADEPAAFAGLFEKLQGPESVSAAGGALRVTTALGRVTLLDRPRFAARFPDMSNPEAPDTPHFAGYRVAVAELARTEALLRRNAVPFRRGKGSLRIAPADAFGIVLEFVAEEGA
jgi:hypothetical protein